VKRKISRQFYKLQLREMHTFQMITIDFSSIILQAYAFFTYDLIFIRSQGSTLIV